ncbi:MAG: hypothetical protein KDB22_30570, partial [Planctomycetales bacterium]|nr:hypothetical protein [Planctomycetales bacterium]
VAAALPDITDSVIIDGFGAGVPTLVGLPDVGSAEAYTPTIEIDGRSTTNADGLRLTAGTSTIRGLSITGFDQSGIEIAGGTGHTIAGNYLGINSGLGFQPEDVAGWWTGDNTTNDFGGTNNGTLMNGATYAPGKVGTAFSFDGVDDILTIAHSASLNATTAVSLSAWVKPTLASGNTFKTIITKG